MQGGGSPDAPCAIDRLLERVRVDIQPRVAADQLERVAAAGALIVDTRPVAQRDRDGDLPGAVVVERNVLEWRLDPTSPHRLAEMDDPARAVVVICDEGYSSSLAAASLRRLGVDATDLEGGYQAWLAARRAADAQ